MIPATIPATQELLQRGDYLADVSLATTVFLALRLQRPLLLEGEAGVGKTEIATVLAKQLGRTLLRLQCYEGLDMSSAAYEWNYPKQMLSIRMSEGARINPSLLGDKVSGANREPLGEVALGDKNLNSIYTTAFLNQRPLLQSIMPGEAGVSSPVLLIDELDRADPPFEAFLLEFLADFQMTIPELGTIKAEEPPIVIITSNRTREINDAVRRRCFYYWVGYPTASRELEIVERKTPGLASELSRQVVDFVQSLRDLGLYKSPGIAETLDWVRALSALDVVRLDPETIDSTLGLLLKYQDDLEKVRRARQDEMASSSK